VSSAYAPQAYPPAPPALPVCPCQSWFSCAAEAPTLPGCASVSSVAYASQSRASAPAVHSAACSCRHSAFPQSTQIPYAAPSRYSPTFKACWFYCASPAPTATRTRSTFLSVDCSTSIRSGPSSTTSPGSGICPAISLTSPPTVAASYPVSSCGSPCSGGSISSPNSDPSSASAASLGDTRRNCGRCSSNNPRSRLTSKLPGTTYEPSTSLKGSSSGAVSCSSSMFPTIASSRSSMVTSPATFPYSSITMLMCCFCLCISRSSSFTFFVSGTNIAGRASCFTFLRSASTSSTPSRSRANATPTISSN